MESSFYLSTSSDSSIHVAAASTEHRQTIASTKFCNPFTTTALHFKYWSESNHPISTSPKSQLHTDGTAQARTSKHHDEALVVVFKLTLEKNKGNHCICRASG